MSAPDGRAAPPGAAEGLCQDGRMAEWQWASHLQEGSVPRAHVAGRHSHVGGGLLGSPAPRSEACWVGGCGPPGTAGGPAQSSYCCRRHAHVLLMWLVKMGN
ncbi:uncharacterized, partial [Tachysurus ichikawai]